MATHHQTHHPLPVTDDNGTHTIRAMPGETLLSQLQAAGIAIGAVCGGGMICGTCHVLLTPSDRAALPPTSAGEIEQLEASEHYDPARSRLACQVIVGAGLGGMIEVAPDD